jgi:hypothetical protein
MKDRRFIELLNLYVDEQLAPAEAAELEAEVLKNPARRRTYDEYCRLQRGCRLLCDGSRSLAPSSQGFARSLREAERKLAAPRRESWFSIRAGLYGATAIASCFAVIFVVNRQDHQAVPDAVLAMNQPAPVVVIQERIGERLPTAVPIVASAPLNSPSTSMFDTEPVLTSPLLSVARTAREMEIASADREALEWMQRVDLLPYQRLIVDDLAFDARPMMQPDNRVFRSRHSLQGNTEFTAFQFQR